MRTRVSRRNVFKVHAIWTLRGAFYHPAGYNTLNIVAFLAAPIVPVQRNPFAFARPNEPLFTRWAETKVSVVDRLQHDQKRATAKQW